MWASDYTENNLLQKISENHILNTALWKNLKIQKEKN